MLEVEVLTTLVQQQPLDLFLVDWVEEELVIIMLIIQHQMEQQTLVVAADLVELAVVV
jgi:hypothetical protein